MLKANIRLNKGNYAIIKHSKKSCKVLVAPRRTYISRLFHKVKS